jgi:hypothetical protein
MKVRYGSGYKKLAELLGVPWLPQRINKTAHEKLATPQTAKGSRGRQRIMLASCKSSSPRAEQDLQN